MKLEQFLTATGLSTKEFADQIGTHRNTILNALLGHDIRVSTAVAIEKATFHKVTCAEMVPTEKRKRNRKKVGETHVQKEASQESQNAHC
jgi:DNA-binding transcriptional regulator YdaS (Cro superfamily)